MISSDDEMTDSPPTTSFRRHDWSHDQLPYFGDRRDHKMTTSSPADTDQTVLSTTTSSDLSSSTTTGTTTTGGDTSSFEPHKIHNKSPQNYRFWQCLCKTVNKASSSSCKFCMQWYEYTCFKGNSSLCDDCKVKVFVSRYSSGIDVKVHCPMCKKEIVTS